MIPQLRRLRVGSLNVWGTFANWPARLAALRQHSITSTLDVLLAQEVCLGSGLDQVSELSETFNLPYHAYHSDKITHGLQEGVAIFSRQPLQTVGMTNLGQGRVLIQADTYGLTLASAHLSFEGRERSEQVKALLKRVTLERVVLGADFNGELATFSKALDRYWTALPDQTPTWPVCGEEVFSKAWAAHTGRAVTFSLRPQRVDHILTRGVAVLSAQTLPLEHGGVFVSDHALVISEMSI